ncbi:MAG: SUMF1/EgtB/PvdO family nonheme iron enzyme, partial [Planctomycetota bacterium]
QAFDARDPRIMAKKVAGEVAEVAMRNPRRTVPEDLARICRKALATRPDERYQSADEMAVDLRRWLDGRSELDRRQKEARKLVARGREAAAKYARLKREVREAEEAAEAEAARYKPYQPIGEKLSMLEARTRAETLKPQVALAFAETTDFFSAALTQEANHADAKAALADLWHQQLRDSEDSGEQQAAVHARSMAERYADGPIASDGTLTLASNPPGAEVLLYRYEEVRGVLSAVNERVLGVTPLDSVPLPMGSYLCLLRKEGFRDTRYPVHITRERRWEGEVRLRTDAGIGDGFVYVPNGPFIYGEREDSKTIVVPDFAMAEFPVTYREYGVFLDSLDEDEAKQRCPGSVNEGFTMERGEDGRYAPRANCVRGPARRRCLREYGAGFERDLPVQSVSWLDATAYCKWKTVTTGVAWRLPSEEEREKAGRGVDGRTFPWGELKDASLARCIDSRKEPPQADPVGAFPTATSVYEMGDAVGNCWEWTGSVWDGYRTSYVFRGGGWNNNMWFARCTFRYGDAPRNRFRAVGFRCAHDF